MKNLVLRSLSGAVYVALIVGAIFAGPYYLYTLMALFGALGILELHRAALPGWNGFIPGLAKAVDIISLAIILFVPVGNIENTILSGAGILPVYLLVRGVIALYDTTEHPFRSVAWSAMSLLYLAMPLLTLMLIYHVQGGPQLVLIMFIMIWLNDTGAFCSGSLMGRHKMFPRLSPKKTWEGFAGGFIFCIVAAWICFRFFNCTSWSLLGWIFFGIIASVFATWGDLFESLLKRNAGVKDSGNIIPGHGGILDRIDSLLFVAPASFLYYFLLTLI